MLQILTKRSTPFGQEGVLLLLQKSTGGSTPFGQEGAGPRPHEIRQIYNIQDYTYQPHSQTHQPTFSWKIYNKYLRINLENLARSNV